MTIVVDMARPLRNLDKMRTVNDGTRSLLESVMMFEVMEALKDWSNANIDAVLINELAVSFYGKPRLTQDVEFLFINEHAIPEDVPGFKRTRAHAFLHIKTHVEVEVISPQYISVPQVVVDRVFSTSVQIDGVKVASPSGLVALKLFSLRPMDKADIIALILQSGIDVSGFSLPQDRIAKYVALVQDADEERFRPPLGD